LKSTEIRTFLHLTTQQGRRQKNFKRGGQREKVRKIEKKDRKIALLSLFQEKKKTTKNSKKNEK